MIRLRSETWDVTSVFEEAVEKVEKDLDDVGLDSIVEEEQGEHGFTRFKSWRFARFLGLYERRVSMDYEEGRISTGTYVNSIFFVFSVLLVVSYCLYVTLLPDLTESIFFGDGGYVIFCSVVLVVGCYSLITISDDLIDIQDYAMVVSWFSNPYPSLACLGILISIFSRFIFMFPPVVAGVIVSVILAGGVFKILTDVYIPREKTCVSKLLVIPFQAVFYRLIPFSLLVFVALGPLSLVSGFDVSLLFYSELDGDLSLLGLSSMFSDFTGGYVGYEAMATLYHGMPAVVYLFVLFIIALTGIEYLSCYRGHRYLKNSRIRGTDSTVISSASAAVFFLSNLLVILLGCLTVAILAYAFTGLVLVPSESTVLVSSGFYSDLPVQAETFIRGSLVVINQVMEELPFLSTTMYTALYYFVFFVPLIITTSLWARHIVSLYQERSSYTDLDSVNTDLTSINVVTVDSEVPVAGPVSTGLGSSSILVSRTVIENLNDDELEAVLRHEEYHIINRDLLANIAASILSVGFGGRNTLLAFYGYPGIEESADKYAVEKTDKQTMLNANKKMYKMSNSLESEDTEIQGLELLWKPLYQFYFGKFLLGTSHRAYAERSEMISDLGD